VLGELVGYGCGLDTHLDRLQRVEIQIIKTQ
jgi:hypothetical protein